MEEGAREIPRCRRSCVSSVVAIVIWVSILNPGYVTARSPERHPLADVRMDGDMVFLTESLESIVKDSKQYRYPPDGFYKIVQDRIPKSNPFPCENSTDKPLWRSKSRPKSVHMLRPGDIDVISAIGDSLTTGNAAREDNLFGFVIQDRGVSFTGGGVGTWHDITTLPNIIKVFNPNLVGYSVGRGDFMSYNAQLNVAIPGALDDEIFDQIKLFMKKILRDKRIDFANDWKMLSIFLGHNDVCSYQCFDRKKHTPNAHKRNLQRALDFLQKNVPKLFVNLISILDPTIIARIQTNSVCRIISRLSCSCMYEYGDLKEGIAQLSFEVRRYQDIERELVFSGRYDDKEDFAVVWQPLFLGLNAPKNVEEPENAILMNILQHEFPIWTPECFHFNQRGLAAVTIQLWNNMLEPVGNKSRTFDNLLKNEYKCPTMENPYLFTRRNSESFNKTAHQ